MSEKHQWIIFLSNGQSYRPTQLLDIQGAISALALDRGISYLDQIIAIIRL